MKVSAFDCQLLEQFVPERGQKGCSSFRNSIYLQDQVSAHILTGYIAAPTAVLSSIPSGREAPTTPNVQWKKGFSYCLVPSPSWWVWWHDLHPREGHRTSPLASRPDSSALCLCKLGKNKASHWFRSTREKPLPRESIRKIVFMVVKFSSLRVLKEKKEKVREKDAR